MPEPSFDGRARTSAHPAQPQRTSGASQRPGSGAAPRHAGAPGKKPAPVQLPPLTIKHCVLCQRGNLRAFFEIQIGPDGRDVAIAGWRLVQEEGKRAWVARPAHERQRVDPQTGELTTRYYPLVRLPDAWQAAVERLILSAWDEYQATGILPGSPVIGTERK